MNDGWSKFVNESNVKCASRGKAKCLALAYNERAEFAGLSAISENSLLTDSQLDYLIPHFGKIVSGSYVPYTIASLYTELGEERIDTRLAAFKRNNRYHAKWFEQVIRVINRLTVSRKIYPYVAKNNSIAYECTGGNAVEQDPVIYDIQRCIDRAIIIAQSHANYPANFGYFVHATAVQYGWGPGIAISTNTKIKLLSNYRNIIKRTNIYATASPWISPPYAHEFNGNGFFHLGENLLFENIEINIDTDGYFDIPDISGESNDNFPKYPETTGVTFGYQLSGFSVGCSTFKFIAGS